MHIESKEYDSRNMKMPVAVTKYLVAFRLDREINLNAANQKKEICKEILLHISNSDICRHIRLLLENNRDSHVLKTK